MTGGHVYRGSSSPLLVGRYLFGDFCSGRIWSLAAGGGSPQAERLLADTDLRITSFGEDVAGEVYVADLGGTVSRIVETQVTRRFGTDRYATAASVAATFPAEVPVVYVATGENYPDAIAGGPAAARDDGPILLVRRDAIPAATAAELARLKPARIVVLGGTAVVSAGVASALAAYTPGQVTRRFGTDRYATAASVAATFPAEVPVVYVATGENYPDAIAGGPAAARDDGPILLVRRDAIPAATAAELARLKPARIVVLGGTAVVSAGVASALAAYTPGQVTRRFGHRPLRDGCLGRGHLPG